MFLFKETIGLIEKIKRTKDGELHFVMLVGNKNDLEEEREVRWEKERKERDVSGELKEKGEKGRRRAKKFV